MPVQTTDVTIRTHEEVLFNGPVVSLTSHNDTGIFDVLGQHANFISLVDHSVVLVEPSGAKREIPVTNGVIRVKGGKVEVYIGIK